MSDIVCANCGGTGFKGTFPCLACNDPDKQPIIKYHEKIKKSTTFVFQFRRSSSNC